MQKSEAPTSVFRRKFTEETFDIGCIQELWANKDQIKGLSRGLGQLIFSKCGDKPRAALLFSRRITSFPLTEFMTKDLACARVDLPTGRGTIGVVVASGYFPDRKNDIPPKEFSELVRYCKAKNLKLISGCDANSHHMEWGSTDTQIA